MSSEIEILVVEDDLPDLRLLTELLERGGYRVRSTADPQLAIESALARPPGLILTDVRMPGIDGFEVCRRLKEDERTRDVPVIFVSALQDTEARMRGFEAGGIDFINKPFEEQEVLARVRTHALLQQMQKNLESLVDERTESLRRSEERYELAVAGSAAGIWDWDIRSGKVFYSDRFKELLGYTAQESWNNVSEFWDSLHPEDEQAVRAALDRHLAEGTPYRVDYRILTGSGNYSWFYARGQALWDEAGKPLRMAGSITDINQRKEAEEELRKREELYELVVEASEVGVWDWDLESGNVYLSERIRAFLGYAPDEEWKHVDVFWENIHPDDVQGVREAYGRLLEKDIPYNREYRIRTRSGEYRWFNARGKATRDETGKPVRVTGSATDITERRMSREKLMRSEHRFRALMEQSPLPIVIYTPDGKINQVNSAWLRLWDLNEEETEEIKAKYNILEDEQIVDLGIDRLIKRAFTGEQVIIPPIEYSGNRAMGEVRLEHIEAKTVWVQTHLAPVMNENREIIFIVLTHVDVTATKENEEEAQRQRESLARMSRVAQMEQMTGSIAHEINQPLTGILSSAQAGELAIGKGECDHDEMLTIMGEIVADAKRASEVIKGLREIYREQKAEHRPVDINALVGDTKQLLHSEFVMQKIELTTEYGEAGPMVSGNRVQIQQVLVNLAMNAAESLRDTAQDSRHVHVGTACGANEIRVWVEDSGPGIDEDKLETIFEPLATWKPGGTGMGLAISNSIVEAHGGRMWAENRPEGGTRVGFALPVMKEEKPA